MTERWEATARTRPRRTSWPHCPNRCRHRRATGTRIATASQAGKSIGVLLALRPAGPAPADTTPPDTAVMSGPSGSTTTAFATFTFSATEPADFLCQLDTGLSEPCTSPKTYVNLADGDHAFAVVATDLAGNADPTPATRSWTIDPIGPTRSWSAPATSPTAAATTTRPPPAGRQHPRARSSPSATTPTPGGDGERRVRLDCYDPTWGRHKARTMPVVGNHEYVGPDADGYFAYFGRPPPMGRRPDGATTTTGSAPGTSSSSTPTAPKSAAAEPARPRSSGCGAYWPHRRPTARSPCGTTPCSAPAPPTAPIPTYRPFWQALYDYGADVVLNGHDHVYERFGFQTPAGAADAVFGLRQFTVGTGGRSSLRLRPPAAQQRGPGAGPSACLKLTLHDGSYDWQFVPEAGKTFTDRGTAACHGAPGRRRLRRRRPRRVPGSPWWARRRTAVGLEPDAASPRTARPARRPVT